MVSDSCMKHLYATIVLCVLFLSGCGGRQTLPQVLSDAEIDEALAYGAARAGMTDTEFLKPWTVDLGYGIGCGSATVITPFVRAAILGRRSAQIGGEVDRKIVLKALAADAGMLRFRYAVYVDEAEAGRKLKAALRCGTQELAPVSFTASRTPEMSRDYFLRVTGEARFSRQTIPPDARVVFLLTLPGDPPKAFTAQFPFDLSSLR